MDRTTRLHGSTDHTTRIDARPATDDGPRVITLPPKDRVNLGLAAVAGALAVLVLFTAHDRLSAGAAPSTAPLSPPAASTPSSAPTEAPAVAPVVPKPPKAGDKGKGHD